MKCILVVRDGVYNKELRNTNYFVSFLNVEYKLACFSSILQLKWLIEANNIKYNKFFGICLKFKQLFLFISLILLMIDIESHI